MKDSPLVETTDLKKTMETSPEKETPELKNTVEKSPELKTPVEKSPELKTPVEKSPELKTAELKNIVEKSLEEEMTTEAEKQETMKEPGPPPMYDSKPLSLEYIADRMDLDDPLHGFVMRDKQTGWLQGFITVTTFTTWQKWFRWDSLADEAGVMKFEEPGRGLDALHVRSYNVHWSLCKA